MKVELLLKGLGCASCAQKIEANVQKLPNVSNATVNFATSTMALDLVNKEITQDTIAQVKGIVKNIEDHVIVTEKTLTRGKQINKISFFERDELMRLILGSILFIGALVSNLSSGFDLIVYLASYLLIGGKVLIKAARNTLKGEVFDENFLMAIATLGAFLIKEYPEAVAVMLFYQIGEGFQNYSVNNSKKSIQDLMDIRPDFAVIFKEGQEFKVEPEEVRIGDIIIIRPGEKLPLDGVILEGNSQFDTSALTGESVPKNIEVGEEVLSGYINKNSLIKVKVTKLYQDSTVAKILEMVENAANKKAPTEKFITKFARYYTPVVVFLAVLIATIPPIVLTGATFSEWIYRALVFLVISCPCALVVSIPLGFFGGIGGAAKNGILIKGGNYLEALNNVHTVIFDKTGTLTKGVFKVTEIKAQPRFSEEEVLKLAATAEVYSNHPIAKSILDAYLEAYREEIQTQQISGYQELAGKGVKLWYDDQDLLVGNKTLMAEHNINIEEEMAVGTPIYVALDGQYAGKILISDEIKEDAARAIEKLRKNGIEQIIMLTGDNQKTGQQIGELLTIDRVYGQLLPHNKVEILEKYLEKQGKTQRIVFVGDGINDAPVLARADIGVAMGGLGSDAAIEAADVVIMNDEPSRLVTALKIARKTNTIVWQNIFLALGIKFLVLGLGALGLASMWEAVFADVGVALLAILNAMRAMKVNS